MRIGHEWCGTVSAVGDGVDPSWVGGRTTGDTMLGCGRCRRCRSGRQHVCQDRFEIGIRGGFPGALAEQLAVPAASLHAAAGQRRRRWPGRWSNRAATRCGPSRPRCDSGDRLLVIGPGTIGLLVAQLARARGRRGARRGRDGAVPRFARHSDSSVWSRRCRAGTAVGRGDRRVELAGRARARGRPGRTRPARRLGRPGGQPEPDRQPTVALKDVTVVGILSGLAGLDRHDRAVRFGTRRSRAARRRGSSVSTRSRVLAGERRPAGATAPSSTSTRGADRNPVRVGTPIPRPARTKHAGSRIVGDPNRRRRDAR